MLRARRGPTFRDLSAGPYPLRFVAAPVAATPTTLALPSAEAPCPPTPLSSGLQAQGRRLVLQPAREGWGVGRTDHAVSSGGSAVCWHCRGAGLSCSSRFLPLPGRDASLRCGVRTQHSAYRVPRTPPGTEAIDKINQLTPHARSFTSLKFLEPFPSRSASLAGHP